MTPRLRVILLLLGLCTFSTAEAHGDGSKAPTVRAAARAQGVEGFQSVHADGNARVFVLVESELRVFEFDGSKLVPSRSLDSAGRDGRPLRAALSLDGRCWLLNGRNGEVLRFEGDDVSTVEAAPFPIVTGLGFVGDSPLLAGRPIGKNTPAGGESSRGIVYAHTDGQWEPLITARADADSDLAEVFERAVVFSSAKDGSAWVVNEYDYRVRRISSTGMTLLDVSAPELRAPRDDPKRQREFEAMIASKRGDHGKVTKVVAVPERIVRAVASRGSDLYVLWRQGSDAEDVAHLDLVSARGSVQRLSLAIPHVERILSMAAGKRDLVFAAARAGDGLFAVSLDELDLSEAWQAVPEIIKTAHR